MSRYEVAVWQYVHKYIRAYCGLNCTLRADATLGWLLKTVTLHDILSECGSLLFHMVWC